MQLTIRRNLGVLMAAVSAAVALGAGSAWAISQSGEAKNMQRVGHTDLQGRPAYQPNVIEYPDGRTIAFVGTHSGSAPNPLKGGVTERNGVMIIDVTDPANPKEMSHTPAPAGGQSQSVRMCLGSKLPGGIAGKVYMLRNVQGGASSGYEVWDVTNVSAPVLKSQLRNLRSTHKPWWECNTGIAYLPGSKNSGALWKQSQSMLIVDWQNPEAGLAVPPPILRTYGLPGSQPSAPVTVPETESPSLHGAISAHEHPNAAGKLARGVTDDEIIGNRVYAAWGVGDDGVMQILDRKKLLPFLSDGKGGNRGGTWVGNADDPSDEDVESAQAGVLYMSPDQGGHTSMPVFGLKPPSYESFRDFKTRDIVLLASEATADLCQEPPHWSFIVDITVENSKAPSAVPPPLRRLHNPWQGPMVLSTMSVDPRDGEKYPRGNYCERGARFGTHSSEENFYNPLYGKLTTIAYFTGGVRVWDIREPQAPVEVAFYVPESNANTSEDGYMTNNVEIDNRGFIFAVDRNGAGLDILQLKGPAANIVFPPGK